MGLDEFVGRFCPATDEDRELIRCAIVTPAWGGQPGQRPAFAIDSKDGDGGRGVGKTTLAVMIGELYRGAFMFGSHEDREKMLKRLLTPSARTTRIGLIDNAKGFLSGEDLESIITARTLSGYANYVGESTRPNHLTWFLTANGLELSKDLAQRVVCIDLATPTYDATWRDDILDFIDKRRADIFADITRLLRADRPDLERFTRWGAWESAVLAAMKEPARLQELITERQATADTEKDEWGTTLDYFKFKLRQGGYADGGQNVRIPTGVAATWYREVTGEPMKAMTASRRLKRLCGNHRELRPDPSNRYGRCFLFFGENTSVDDVPVLYDEHRAGLFETMNRQDGVES